MSDRPEYVKCARMLPENDASWCGRVLPNLEWAFTSADHAALNGRHGGRLVLCTECRKAIVTALSNGAAS